jgi:serine/threonine protein phosphatase PrpC
VTSGLALAAAARSVVGPVRANNEDAVFASPRLAAVADGVGGAAAGEVASATVINALVHLDKCRLRAPLDEALAGAVAEGNAAIAFIVECRPRTAGMSTTLTAVALGDDGALVLAHVGDSRTYLLRDSALRRLSRDDTLVQDLIDRGTLTAAEARRHPQRSVVLRALDGDPARRPAIAVTEARAGDRLLLCSDGLSDVVEDGDLGPALGSGSPRACADRLVARALAAGARDNVSAVVADVAPERGPAERWAP